MAYPLVLTAHVRTPYFDVSDLLSPRSTPKIDRAFCARSQKRESYGLHTLLANPMMLMMMMSMGIVFVFPKMLNNMGTVRLLPANSLSCPIHCCTAAFRSECHEGDAGPDGRERPEQSPRKHVRKEGRRRRVDLPVQVVVFPRLGCGLHFMVKHSTILPDHFA
jgi:hypothetical protein